MIVINSRFLTQPITGVQRFAIEIAKELKNIYKGDVVFVSPHNILQHAIAQELDVKIIGWHTGYIWEQIDLPIFLKRKNNPLLINLANMAPVFYKNKLSTIHDVAFLKFPQTFSKSFLYSYRFLIPLIIKSSKQILTVSEFSKLEICKAYEIDKEKVSIIYNAVSNKFKYHVNTELKSQQFFLSVSSLNYRKNFIAVLKAFELYSQTHEKINLYVIGDIKNANFKNIDINNYISNPRIKFLGRVTDDELIDYYSNAMGFIYPSIYEGFGIPPLEAQICNCPILISDIPVLKEIFKSSAVYCNPYDIHDIAKKMNYLSEYSSIYIEKGKLNAQRFSWNKSAENLKSIIENIK